MAWTNIPQAKKTSWEVSSYRGAVKGGYDVTAYVSFHSHLLKYFSSNYYFPSRRCADAHALKRKKMPYTFMKSLFDFSI